MTEPITALGWALLLAYQKTGYVYWTKNADDAPRAPIEVASDIHSPVELQPVVVGAVRGECDDAFILEAEKLPFTKKWSPIFGLSLKPRTGFRIVEVREDGTRVPCTWLEYREIQNES